MGIIFIPADFDTADATREEWETYDSYGGFYGLEYAEEEAKSQVSV